MTRELTMRLPDEVYDELERRVGHDNIGDFTSRLVRPHVVDDEDLDEAYRAMAADTERERDALAWIEAAPDDALPRGEVYWVNHGAWEQTSCVSGLVDARHPIVE